MDHSAPLFNIAIVIMIAVLVPEWSAQGQRPPLRQLITFGCAAYVIASLLVPPNPNKVDVDGNCNEEATFCGCALWILMKLISHAVDCFERLCFDIVGFGLYLIGRNPNMDESTLARKMLDPAEVDRLSAVPFGPITNFSKLN